MSPELRLVKGDLDASNPTTSFGPNRQLPTRIAQGSLLAAMMCGLSDALIKPTADNTPLRLALGAAAVFLFAQGAWAASIAIRRASIRYTLSSQRLEIERGLMSRRRESIDLYRIRDVVLDQTFFERMRGLGTLTLYSTDQVEPTLALPSLSEAHSIYETLRDAAARARQQRVVQVDR